MNTWTTLLTPTELEKTFARKKVDKSSNKPKIIQITRPDGTTQTFNSTTQAVRSLGISHPTIKKGNGNNGKKPKPSPLNELPF
nr:MAG TPA: NUMOD1 domain protein [Caudoviricetes sp.]